MGQQERRRTDIVGNIPQWLTSILLAMIGTLVLMIWSSMENRVKQLEASIAEILKNDTSRTTDIATLKQHALTVDQSISEIKVGQANVSGQVTTLVGEIKALNVQLQNIMKVGK